MKYIIVGGDRRFECLERLIKRTPGNSAWRVDGKNDMRKALSEIGGADCIVLNNPIKDCADGLDFFKVIENASEKALVFSCGPQVCAVEDRRVIDLWRDEILINDNAVLTAEGAVAAAMQAGNRSVRDMSCLVIGWGRIGRALTELLVGMGVKTTVASRSPSGRNRAIERGALAVNTDYLRLKGFDVVFSTPPHPVLHDKILKKADKDVMILDLASPPYGVDLKAAWDLGLRAWREPGLPGRYCPESAAMAIMRAIDRGIEWVREAYQ